MPDPDHPPLFTPRPSSQDEVAVQAWLDHVIIHYYRQLYCYALSLTGHEADAADITQQSAVKFSQNWSSIREDGAIRAWLYTTLYREFLLFRRRTRKTVEFEETHLPVELHQVSPQELNADGSTAMELLQRMDEPHRSVLSLFYIDDLSYREIAEVLNIPAGTVMSRLSRAKDTLRTLLAPAL